MTHDLPRQRRHFLLAVGALLSAPVLAHGDHSAHATVEPKSEGSKPVTVTLADTPLLDQDGRRVRLKTDVLAGRIVVVDFIYTTCTTICPIFTATMASLQERLGATLGQGVHLVSVTVDPARDTPRRLKEYAAKHHARPDGWTWLTGARADVDALNKAFGSYTPNIDDHPPMVMVGDTASGAWTRFYGFPSAAELEARVQQLLTARRGKG